MSIHEDLSSGFVAITPHWYTYSGLWSGAMRLPGSPVFCGCLTSHCLAVLENASSLCDSYLLGMRCDSMSARSCDGTVATTGSIA